ncbi:right-handed parallel beta-helix repeat-containing protein [Williamwhitmania taraxaci]|uniref:Right handed beta helix region n=1 Tax=Williamwhitmania taraxaci TaxID=1640674 RepID=A0A1G6GT48_9BACT|nr:right-handed parallel beta-helix repeat-containing protein [Williamwhitmania taraxaci]SDB84346.1 Right handed beta helix region [Williamwhitmania taraxaci]
MRFLFIAATFLFFFFLACQKDEISHSASDRLLFSRDTVMFDTVFTTVGSATARFKVYNKGSQRVNISDVTLSGGSFSSFRINIDGEPGPKIQNLEMAAGDSIYVFVNVTVDPQGSDSPLAIEDSILFNLNGNLQSIKLLAWGQDVVLLNTSVIATQVFTANKPYLIYGDVVVSAGANLTIEAGARFYFHNNSRLYVDGSLKANGTEENPISFQGDRLEDFYATKAGQWGGLYFRPGSYGNLLNWVNIKNAVNGVQVDTFAVANTPTLIIQNSRVENMSAIGLLARGAIVRASNCLFANCGQATVALVYGGNYEFVHCTLANYWGTYYSRKYPQLWLNNYYITTMGGASTMVARDLDRADFVNCIVYGSMSNEVWVDNSYYGTTSPSKMNYTFENSIVRIPSGTEFTLPHYSGVKREDPKFADIVKFSYLLDTLSPAKDFGRLDYGELYPVDLKGESRIADSHPDAGAFERIEKPSRR